MASPDQSARRSDDEATSIPASELLNLAYAELRAAAKQLMADQPPGCTLQPTALVHEAYVRMLAQGHQHWESKAHFFRAAAKTMRHILVDRARNKRRIKHGGGRLRVPLEDSEIALPEPSLDLIALDEALTRLEGYDQRAAEIIHLRYFAGLTVDETAAFMELSRATINREWAHARAWLYQEVSKGDTTMGQEGSHEH